MKIFLAALLLMIVNTATLHAVSLGIDQLLLEENRKLLNGKCIGIVTNHTAINGVGKHTIDVLKNERKRSSFSIIAMFAPEHGLHGDAHSWEEIADLQASDGIPIYGIHGKTNRPTEAMLKGVDLLVYDIQDIGSRSYTYATTLFYVMEEAAKRNIPVIVLDRPNPINGIVVDGPMMKEELRSIVGYINVPYCHGMTIGELAKFFNEEYRVGCRLTVIPMNGWRREMSFEDTRLKWIPTSPHIPEASTPKYYPMTGILGELSLVSIGVGYTLPFKAVGAPWIDGQKFAEKLNAQKFPGVYFHPLYFKPFYGKFSNQQCQGVLITVTDHLKYKPVSIQYLIIGILKGLYPVKFQEALMKAKNRKDMFAKVNGTHEAYALMEAENSIVWKLIAIDQLVREEFIRKRQKYLLPQYNRL